MSDASQQDAPAEELSGAPIQNLLALDPTGFILSALAAFILKNAKMPLLKRINSASGVSLCQEKMRGRKKATLGNCL